MRTRFARASLVAALVAASLSGCSLFDALYDEGPPRDDQGSITEAKEVPATTLRVDDCFSFLPDGSLENVTAIPCGDEHTYIVIGQGELTADEVDAAGGMQNAVSAACKDTFDTFKAGAADGVKPQLQFLVANLEHDGVSWSAYSCVATDGTVTAGG